MGLSPLASASSLMESLMSAASSDVEFFFSLVAGKMTQKVKLFAIKCDDLSLIPRTHNGGRKRGHPQVVL